MSAGLYGQTSPDVLFDSSRVEIRTPKVPDTPRLNGPHIFGVRPSSPFLYSIPASGQRPMQFSVDNLPAGLTLDPNTGQITGKLMHAGTYDVVLRAKNALGSSERKFRIIAGDKIALTPALGWNSWNIWAAKVNQEKVLACAKAIVSSGLSQHGWTYVNIDDTWQGQRGGPFKGIQPNQKFPDMKGLADAIHGMGLKIGIYSTPWVTSYAGYCGGSSDSEDGTWTKQQGKGSRRDGKFPFATNDAKQWAAWGIDYLKYDWNPCLPSEVAQMANALKASGRDMVFSLSNSGKFQYAADYAKLANSWRTGGDIRDNWKSLDGRISPQVKWAPFAGLGHRNDPDMLVVGHVFAWKDDGHASHLTPDEQYTHITMWALLGAPMLMGNDMEKLDPFTLGLLTNDEVLDIDQDSLGLQAVPVGGTKDDGKSTVVYAKKLDDGTQAVGFLNETESAATISVRWSALGLSGNQPVRDVWREKDLGTFPDHFEMRVAPHGTELLKIGTPSSAQ
ncbi:MAG TPA: putative Ig domain-containing protein [Candidatus Methylacidiphilales bacterium]|nr:putative Ig domain-containing protein [Candidatus Methylacidiphilales bacterium]